MPYQDLLRRLACTCSLVLLTWCLPAAAAAQGADAFARALLAFTTAQQGTFGDEGSQLTTSLDALDRALSAWDGELLLHEQRAASEVLAVPADRASHIRTTLGLEYLRRGRLSEAGGQFDAALVPNGDPRAGFLRAIVHEAAGNEAEAAAAFMRAWERTPANISAAYKGWQYRAHLDPGAVRRLEEAFVSAARLESRLEAMPFPPLAPVGDDGPPLLPLAAYADGYRLIARHAYTEGLARFRSAVALDPLTSPDARDERFLRAVGALREGKAVEARRQLETLVQAMPESAPALRAAALYESIDERYDSSAAHLEGAVRLAPRDERARIALARVLVQTKAFDAAERLLQDTIAVLPMSGAAQWWLSTVLSSLNRGADARRALQSPSASLALTGRRDLHAAVSELYESEGEFAGTIAPLRAGAALVPGDPAFHLALARAYGHLDRLDDVLVEYVMALAVGAEPAPALVGIGQAHLAAGRIADAVRALERSIVRAPANAEARYALATALRRAGRQPDADAQLAEYARLQTAATLERQRSLKLDVLREEAALRSAQGDHGRASDLWREVAAQEPGVSTNLVGLGASLAAAGREAEAIEAYERAVRLPAAPRAYRELAALYDRAGRPDDARRSRAAAEQALQTTLRPPVPAR